MRIQNRAALLLAFGATVIAAAAATAQDRSEEVVFEGEFELRAGGSLTAVLEDMDIVVEPGAASVGRVRVIASATDMAWAREVFGRAHFDASASGGDLEIRTEEEEIDWRQHRDRGWVQLRAEIVIPERYEVDVRTGDGDVVIGSFSGRLRAQTGDGDVAIGRVTGESIDIRTGDGDVVAESLDGEEILLETGDGDLLLERVSGAVTAESGDGDVSMEVIDFSGISIRTGDGDVWLAVDAGIGADVDIRGEDVDLARAFSLDGMVRERRISGMLNAGGPRLSVRTGDGSITVRAR